MPRNTLESAPDTLRNIAQECKVKGQSFRAFLGALDTLKGRKAVVVTMPGHPGKSGTT